MSESTLRTLGSTFVIKPGSVGEAVPGIYCKVIDERGTSLGPRRQGELCFKGDLMKGYIDTRTDGFIQGTFFIVDRLKELIKCNAYQVAPAEIEALLLSNPKVKDCGVIGIPDEKAGELPFAYVVKQPGVQLTVKEITQFVADNASKAKRLRIPRNPSGKILRSRMRKMFMSSISKL